MPEGSWARFRKLTHDQSWLKLDEDGQINPVLNLLEIRVEPGHKRPRRTANIVADERRWTRRRRDAARSRKIRHIRGAMIKFPPERNVLARHPIKRSGRVPRLERVARILRKVGRSRSRSRSVDR